MYTDKTSLLGITQRLPLMAAQMRSCSLEVDSIYGPFIKYSGEISEVRLDSSFIPELLSLVRPLEPSDWPEVGGWQGPSKEDLQEHIPLSLELDPADVVDFVNRWGMVGRLSDLFESPMYGEYYPPQGLEFDNPEQGWEMKLTLRETIPYHFVEDELIRMARCVRLVLRLLQGNPKAEEDFKLTVGNRRRVIAGWGLLPLEIPAEKDPATFKNLSEIWVKTTIFKGKRIKYVDLAENALLEFSQKMNSYLSPLSSMVFRTQSIATAYSGKIGLETALASYLLERLDLAGAPFQCNNCRMMYFPERRKIDARYCSQRCGQAVRTRKYRASLKKKEINQKIGSKITKSKTTSKGK